jgi:hypothetical protein
MSTDADVPRPSPAVVRAAVAAILVSRDPLAAPLTAKEIARRLPYEVPVRSLQYHIRQIHELAELRAAQQLRSAQSSRGSSAQ